ncbi:LLM class flavin-dependent oxidoreductase [Pseudofrankia sp. DC12]|uniref:LLM class flavin-dependent oxidoreductase n=1 Tax=Pseudofrankia sp. DC12 TaxID=683315 RepID=UPI000AEDF7A6|nr:LLM class flavin-dependent oxidoreductase [Pseudofrankia sp. DC12]
MTSQPGGLAPAPFALPLSVLDLVPVGTGVTPGDAIRNSLHLARRTEQLGFTRYWLAEHHGMPGIASAATALLIGQVAAATETIRVGSGGVMLPNHAPLVVAEQFGTLGAMFPGRIDLGLGRAPGTDQATARALRRTQASPSGFADRGGTPGRFLVEDEFPDQIAELTTFLAGAEFPKGHRLHGVTAFPRAEMPPIWLLGSSGYSAQVAGILSLPFAFAHHFSAQNTLPALELYRSSFRPSAGRERPYAMVAAAVLVADTDEQAEWLAGPIRLTMMRLRTGRPGTYPTPEEAAAYPWTDQEREVARQATASHVVGSPERVRRGLRQLLDATGADELMVTTNVHAHTDRVHSYELLAGLGGDLVPSRTPAGAVGEATRPAG